MKTHLLGTTMLAPFAVFAMAADADARIKALKDEIAELAEQQSAIINAADEAGEDLTDAQVQEVEDLKAKIEAKKKQLAARESVAASATGTGRRSNPEPSRGNNGDPYVQSVPANLGAKGGFKSLGEFGIEVFKATRPNAQLDRRLQAAATTYGNEGTGADGGFAVPAEFRREIWQKTLAEENLLTRCDPLVTGTNSITIPKDETTPWQTTGGVQVYWESEAAVATQSKPALEMASIRLNKLMALVPMSDESLEDAPQLESWLRAKAPAKMAAKINTAIVRGTGAGQPLGILNSASLITVAKESGPQTADTVWAVNIAKMWARLYAPCRRNAVWLINQDIEPQLDLMAFDPSASPKTPVYLPPGGLSVEGYGTLKGRPVVPIEACSTLGDLGDIILVDLTKYMALTKGSDIKTDVSMHLFFDQGLQAFRFTFRVNGQPWWGSSLAPQHGTNTRSWAVTLEPR